MYEKQLPPLPPQFARDRMSPGTVVAPPQPLSQRNPLSYVNRQTQPGSDILASLEQEILKLRRENDALRRSMLFQTIRSAIETYRDDKKDQAGHLPQRFSEELVSGTFSDRVRTGSKRPGGEGMGAARRSAPPQMMNSSIYLLTRPHLHLYVSPPPRKTSCRAQPARLTHCWWLSRAVPE
ncbi:hypothetical protein EDB80DRAFT_756991 [Ilyonectria destructans]|nr:hypothetical protein EDB80DRAFT_756991 [Ilyonectria destructans]